MQQIVNFSQFYALLRLMPYKGDRDDLKRDLVLQGTSGRTTSLREVSMEEYNGIIRSMERLVPKNNRKDYMTSELRRNRSLCLRLLHKIGVDTSDWTAINGYCKSPRIAGKEFRELSVDDLYRLSLKLRMILKKQRDI